MSPGDLVTWTHEPRGGYGYQYAIPATVVRVGAKRVQIEAQTATGAVRRVWVTPDRLERRPGEDGG